LTWVDGFVIVKYMLTQSQQRRVLRKLRRSIPGVKNNEYKKVSILNVYDKLIGGKTKKSARATLALCPFHEENNPSFAMYEDTNSYFCFACGEKGSAIDLIMFIKDCSFSEAIEIAKEL